MSDSISQDSCVHICVLISRLFVCLFVQPTRLCGTATRSVPVGVDFDVQAYSYCSAEYASTMGTWVHGAMTWDAITGIMSFYLGGVQLTTVDQQALSVNNAGTVGTSNGFNVELFHYIEDLSRVEYFLANGTGLDNMRAWSVPRAAEQIASSFNSPLFGNETNLIEYFLFHGLAYDIYGNYMSYYSPTDGSYYSQITEGGTSGRFVYPTSNSIQNCQHAGCGQIGTSQTEYIPSNNIQSSSTGNINTETSSSSSAPDDDGDNAATNTATSTISMLITLVAVLFTQRA
jgi:hypothetical protein